MVIPPRGPVDPWYRRHTGYYRRPFSGFGCLYYLITFVLLYLLFSFFFRALWFF